MNYGDDFPTWLKHIYYWQTMIAGVLALGGAWLALLGINWQISQGGHLEEARRQRENTAARAVLPLALSQLTRYSKECIQLLDRYREFNDEGLSIPAGTRSPRIESGIISALQDCVRFADGQYAKQISTLLGKVQVQSARIESFVREYVGEQLPEAQTVSAMIDAADIYAHVDELYEYGREIESVRKSAGLEKLQQAVRVCGIWEDDHPLMERLAQMAKNASQST